MLAPSLLSNVLLLALIGVIAVHTAHLIHQGRFMILDPLYMFWGGIVICCIFQPVEYGDILVAWNGLDTYEMGLTYVVLGCIMVIAGYESNIGGRIARKFPYPPWRISSRVLWSFGLVFLGTGAIGYLVEFRTAGGLQAWLSVGRGGTKFESISGYLAVLSSFLPMGIYLMLVLTRIRRFPWYVVYAIWSIGGLQLYWFLYLGSRSRVIMMSVLLLATYYLPKRINPPLKLALFVFAMLLLATRFQQAYRGNFTDMSFHWKDIEASELLTDILPGIFTGHGSSFSGSVSSGLEFNVLLTTIKLVPNRISYNYGYGILEVLTRPIPRSLWPGKIYPSLESIQGVLSEGQLSNWRISSKELLAGPAFNFAAFWYYAYGIIGILIGGLWTGWLLRAIRSYYDMHMETEGAIFAYPLLVNVGFLESGATPFFWVFSIGVTFVPVFIALKIAGLREQRLATQE